MPGAAAVAAPGASAVTGVYGGEAYGAECGPAKLTGRIVRPEDPGYTDARLGWHQLFSHYPLVIVFAQNTQDVVNALTWARQNDVALRIRSGRHSLEGWSNVDSGLVIDISELKSVHIDSASRIATVGSGLNQLEAVTTLAKQNFAVTLVDAITGHLEHYAAAGQHGHVFVGPQGGQLRRSNFRDDWVKARKDAGVTAELHFHDLRHTGNTLASTAGASTRELMTRVGHSGSRAALIYQHMTSDRDRAIADQGGPREPGAHPARQPDHQPRPQAEIFTLSEQRDRQQADDPSCKIEANDTPSTASGPSA